MRSNFTHGRTDLVKEVAPAARRRDALLSFAFVYPDTNGRFVLRDAGKHSSNGFVCELHYVGFIFFSDIIIIIIIII